MPIERFIQRATPTISNGSPNSSKVECAAASSGSFKVRDGLTGASVTFEQEDADGNWHDVYDSEGAEFSLTIDEDKWYCLPTELVMCVDNFRFVSASNEGAARTIDVVLKR